MKNIKSKIALALAAGALTAQNALADVPADITEIVTDATTVFTAVSALVVTVVAFYILVRMVRGIKAR